MPVRLGSDTGSVVNWMMQQKPGEDLPKVGDGATILMWSDRQPATVIDVRASKRPKIWIQNDSARPTNDVYSRDTGQEWAIERDPEGAIHEVTLQGGVWRIKGGGEGVRFGSREKYRDPSF